jgi:hypothetical protein
MRDTLEKGDVLNLTNIRCVMLLSQCCLTHNHISQDSKEIFSTYQTSGALRCCRTQSPIS